MMESVLKVDLRLISRLHSFSGAISRTTMVIAIVASVLVILALIVGCVAWRFWRKRRRASQDAADAAAMEAQAQANPKQIDIEDPDPKYCAGARSGNPEIIRNFVASKQNEKNTNKTQENPADEKLPKGKAHKENTR